MYSLVSALSILSRIMLLAVSLYNIFGPQPDRTFAICCFILYVCITIERGVEGIRSALEVLVTIKNELDKNKKETT